jgi:hypothetical protein
MHDIRVGSRIVIWGEQYGTIVRVSNTSFVRFDGDGFFYVDLKLDKPYEHDSHLLRGKYIWNTQFLNPWSVYIINNGCEPASS